MYAVSNQQRDEIITLLAALKDLPETDKRETKTFNLKRRAGIMIKKLNKAKYLDYEDVKHRKG